MAHKSVTAARTNPVWFSRRGFMRPDDAEAALIRAEENRVTDVNPSMKLDPTAVHRATVVVIGGGQAGLSAAYHLTRRGFASALLEPDAPQTYVVLDAETAPGGAWQHRWESLQMETINGIFDLPGFPSPPIDASEPSRDAVPRYFGGFEAKFDFPIVRPTHVTAVRPVDDDPEGDLRVESDRGTWLTRAVINATGTWTNPITPYYPGAESFLGRQLHTQQFEYAEDFTGMRVAVVGGGISALQQLEEISRYATTYWYTRREPVFLEEEFAPETTGRQGHRRRRSRPPHRQRCLVHRPAVELLRPRGERTRRARTPPHVHAH
jgi:cation diffusion facilitator CzcD-associated flavoprotein CzcO